MEYIPDRQLALLNLNIGRNSAMWKWEYIPTCPSIYQVHTFCLKYVPGIYFYPEVCAVTYLPCTYFREKVPNPVQT